MSAIDQMARVYRWACSEKRQTLEDLLRLAERLRSDLGRIEAANGPAGEGQTPDERRTRLDRSIAEVDASIEQVRADLAVAEAELARVEQTKHERETAERTSNRRRPRTAGQRA